MSACHIVICGYQNRLLTCCFQGDTLIDLQAEQRDARVRVGGLYIGKVKYIVQNISAAFVEFLPGCMGYYSLTENTEHHFVNPGRKAPVVAGDELLVRVSRENLKTKSWTLSSALTFSGRFVVLDTSHVGVRISSRIRDKKERERLAQIISGKDPDHGWTVRTLAEGREAPLIEDEMDKLLVDHNEIMSTYRMRTCYSVLRKGVTAYEQMIQRHLPEGGLKVTTDLPEVAENLKGLPGLRFYQDDYPLIKLYNIEARVEKALAKKVWLKSGAYLVIEPTEALTVIDVNTGKSTGKGNYEDHFYKINLEAAGEAMRQIRLRGLSGIILIDFINMKDEDHLRSLMECLRRAAAQDPVRTTVVDRTALQLVEITRKKERRTLREQLSDQVSFS